MKRNLMLAAWGTFCGLMVCLCVGFGGCGSGEETNGTQDVTELSSGDARLDVGREDLHLAEDLKIQEVDAGRTLEEVPIEPTDGFLTRKAAYLQSCSDSNGPDSGGLYGQTCRIVKGETTFNQTAIAEALTQMSDRKDTADFRLAGFVRMLYLDAKHNALPEELRASIETTLLGFRYWLTEPGNDKMCYWTENHQILYHSGELLMGQMYRDKIFGNSGMTGQQHVAHAEPLVIRWLDFRGKLGFSEWHSNVYFNEDIPALLNLADFAENQEIRTKAAMVLDVMLIDMLANTYKGYFATTHGRTYSSKFLNGLKDSTSPVVWLAAGVGTTTDYGNFSAAFLATSEGYVPAPLLEPWALAIADRYEHRQRDSLDVADGPDWGLGYKSIQDVVVWAGLSAIAAPEVVEGLVKMLDDYALWDGFLIGDLPEPYKGMLKKMSADPASLRKLAIEMAPVSRGIALENVNTYTYRTPYYQLSGAQDYKPGFWSAQTQIWIAALDGSAFVLTSFPGNMDKLGTEQEFGDLWIGGWQPRVTLHRSVGVIQYRSQKMPLLDEYLTGDYVHALFPRAAFDEVVEVGAWVCGRKGDGYLALASQTPARWSDLMESELIADAIENVWVVQMGSKEESGDFESFVDQLELAELTFEGGTTRFQSPAEGLVEVSWEGPMLLDGKAVDIGPYQRFEGEHAKQQWGEGTLTLEFEGKRLELDFDAGSRHVWAIEE